MVKNFKIEYLMLKELGYKSLKNNPQKLIKKWPITVAQKGIHNSYSEKLSTNITQKNDPQRYSKNDQQTLLKKVISKLYSKIFSTSVTQKMAHNFYSNFTQKCSKSFYY